MYSFRLKRNLDMILYSKEIVNNNWWNSLKIAEIIGKTTFFKFPGSSILFQMLVNQPAG
jgi:hypothetical protein